MWLEYGPGPELTDTINRVLREDRSIDPLISGLVNLCSYLLAMLARALGASPQALLGGFVSTARRAGAGTSVTTSGGTENDSDLISTERPSQWSE